PESELDPLKVLLRAFYRPGGWPASPLKRIETQVDQVGHIRFGLFAQPALGLVTDPVLVVVNTHRSDGAFAEVKDFVAVRWTFASNGVHLVVTVKMVLVSPVAKFHALKQLVGDVR